MTCARRNSSARHTSPDAGSGQYRRRWRLACTVPRFLRARAHATRAWRDVAPWCECARIGQAPQFELQVMQLPASCAPKAESSAPNSVCMDPPTGPLVTWPRPHPRIFTWQSDTGRCACVATAGQGSVGAIFVSCLLILPLRTSQLPLMQCPEGHQCGSDHVSLKGGVHARAADTPATSMTKADTSLAAAAITSSCCWSLVSTYVAARRLD